MAKLGLGITVFVVAVGVLLRVFSPDVLVFLASPFWKLGDTVSASFVSFENTDVLIVERDKLKSDNETLLHENETLRARLLDVGAESSGEGVLAGVLSRPPLAPYDVLVVARGFEDGVVVGAHVFAKGVPIGTVNETGLHTAHVLLYSSPGRTTEGWVGEERLPLTLVGEGAGAYTATVPRETPINPGDTVYTPGPGAYPAGTIHSIESHASSPSAKVIIEPLVNPFTVTWVHITP